MARESASMEGVIDSIIYKNEENGYTIARALLDDGGELTLVGTIPFLGAGEHISATGTVTLHPQHGPQFQVESYYREMPQEFLRLTALRLLLEYLPEHHLPTWYAAGLTAAYGDRAAAELERNPYILCREPYLLPFSQADALAAEAGIEGDSALRLEAGVLYVLSFNLQAGHTFLPRQKLLATAGQLLGREGDGLEPVLEALLDRKALRQETLLGLEAVYLAPVYDQEAFAAAQAARLVKMHLVPPPNLQKNLKKLEQESGLSYADKQREAICMPFSQGLTLVTGGPGTGKTTALMTMISCWRPMGSRPSWRPPPAGRPSV